MNVLKKYWYVTLLLLGTAGLGITALLISLRVQQQEAINTPPPRAATPECTLTFNINGPTPAECEIAFDLTIPSSTPTNTPTSTSTPTPSNTPTRTPTQTPTNTPTRTPTPSITPTGTLTPTATPTHTPTPSNTPTRTPTQTPTPSNTPTGTLTPTMTPSPTNTPAPGACNTTCSSNSDCMNSYICSAGHCRNPQCTEQPNCACYFVPTPKVPVTGTGTTIVGVAVVAGGIILLLLGLVL